MIITRTPLRISFAGGGSDLPEYYRNFGGAVLSASINKFVYLSMHPYFHESRILLKYSRHELVDNVAEIEHRIIRNIFTDYHIAGVDFSSSADVPSGTGLGSSSAFTVGLTSLCNAYTNRYMSKEQLAEYACTIEIQRMGEPIGKQDQYASAMGGMNFLIFNQDDSVGIERMILPRGTAQRLQDNLLMFSMGISREAGSILSEQKKNTVMDPAVQNNLRRMVELARELKDELGNGRIDAFGDVLHRGWIYKRELASTITNARIDRYYDLAIKNGATGGKLLGAGGSGFLLFYVEPENQEQLKTSLADLKQVPFAFENSGATIIYYDQRS